MRVFIIICLTILFFGCSPKLKVYSIHSLMEDKKIREDNFYLRDKSNTYERLKGTYLWSNGLDTLILKFTPIYKKKITGGHLNPPKNAFFDTNEIKLRHVKDGKVIFDNFEHDYTKVCLYADHFGVYTTQFYFYNRCDGKPGGPLILFLRDDILLVNQFVPDYYTLLKKEGEYEVVIPRNIVLKNITD